MTTVVAQRVSVPAWRRLASRAWAPVASVAARLNGTALPRQLDAADRAELERTIFG